MALAVVAVVGAFKASSDFRASLSKFELQLQLLATCYFFCAIFAMSLFLLFLVIGVVVLTLVLVLWMLM